MAQESEFIHYFTNPSNSITINAQFLIHPMVTKIHSKPRLIEAPDLPLLAHRI
jgi:hypothetical protein